MTRGNKQRKRRSTKRERDHEPIAGSSLIPPPAPFLLCLKGNGCFGDWIRQGSESWTRQARPHCGPWIFGLLFECFAPGCQQSLPYGSTPFPAIVRCRRVPRTLATAPIGATTRNTSAGWHVAQEVKTPLRPPGVTSETHPAQGSGTRPSLGPLETSCLCSRKDGISILEWHWRPQRSLVCQRRRSRDWRTIQSRSLKSVLESLTSSRLALSIKRILMRPER